MNIGIIGGGQLGRMLALAGAPLGIACKVLDPGPHAPAGQIAPQVVGDFDDPAALDQLAHDTDVVTYEFENVPVTSAIYLANKVPIHPAPQALEAGQDRFTEKTFFQSHGLRTPPFRPVNTAADLAAAVEAIGLPAVLKTRRLGYDGKGQFVLHAPADVDKAWAALGSQPLILEGFVHFERELSILAARDHFGNIVFYPLVENHHRDGILRLSLAPAPDLTPALQSQAETYSRRILEALAYVGLLAIELFQCGDELLANEMAPRVHNSGHWSIEGAVTSQFENHLRAIAGLPLGATTSRGHSAMFNLIGTLPEPSAILSIPNAHLHLYGKSPRPGRKLGHVTLTSESPLDPHTFPPALQALLATN